jgi:hypothetical protein
MKCNIIGSDAAAVADGAAGEDAGDVNLASAL